jgi:hypothetical protein
MQTPVMVMNTNSKRETGRKAQLASIQAAKVNHLTLNAFAFISFYIASKYLRL